MCQALKGLPCPLEVSPGLGSSRILSAHLTSVEDHTYHNRGWRVWRFCVALVPEYFPDMLTLTQSSLFNASKGIARFSTNHKRWCLCIAWLSQSKLGTLQIWSCMSRQVEQDQNQTHFGCWRCKSFHGDRCCSATLGVQHWITFSMASAVMSVKFLKERMFHYFVFITGSRLVPMDCGSRRSLPK